MYYEPAALQYPRAQEILARFPGVEHIEIASHWKIPELHGNPDAAEDWLKNKREILVLGVRKTFPMRVNGRSGDFVASSVSSGCAMACAYCVAAGTMIATPNGDLPVERVADGDTVYAYNPETRQLDVATVAGIASRPVNSLLEIKAGDAVLHATTEHPIMTERGWVEAGAVAPDDRLLCSGAGMLRYVAVQYIEHVQTATTVYNFHVPGLESYVANGVVTHNCYVPRRKGFANPITTFVNIDQMCGAIAKHAAKQGVKLDPNQVDPDLWVYDIGENGDCSVDALISDNVRDLVALFRDLPNAKASFATKFVNRDLLDYDPQGKTRIRFSLMPPEIAKVVDVRTSPIADRIAALNDFVAASYELHLNFSPVIIYDGWLDDYARLFTLVDDALDDRAKAQVKAEVIFLTHNEQLHEVNLRWHPTAEDLLWQPPLQEAKTTLNGGDAVRYRHGMKGRQVAAFCDLLARHMPYCTVRYAF